MRIDDLHRLPKFRDSLSTLYVEHARIDQDAKSIAIHDAAGVTPVPAANLAVLMLGPGVRITHSAISTLADNNCLVIWCGEENVRFYAYGTGGTRGAALLLHQARLATDEALRLEVVKRMYRMRFAEPLGGDVTVNSLRGMEGARVRDAYADASRKFGIEWSGRQYDRGDWAHADPVNRALSAANSCLYGLCHAAILSIGCSPGLGFIHTGKQLSFVYDIADLYKVEITVPLAFEMATGPTIGIERQVRIALRDRFRETKLMQRIVPDIVRCLAITKEMMESGDALEGDPALPTDLWTPEGELRDPAGSTAEGDESGDYSDS